VLRLMTKKADAIIQVGHNSQLWYHVRRVYVLQPIVYFTRSGEGGVCRCKWAGNSKTQYWSDQTQTDRQTDRRTAAALLQRS
jgi:hypothetical protein